MKNAFKAVVAAALLATASAAWATPSTTFWTPATTYVQPYLVPHVTYDSYVAEKGGLANDYGLTIGVLPFEKLQGEIGIDSFMPGIAKNNIYLNGKIGIPEGAFDKLQPGLSFGVFGVGFEKDVSDFDILHGEIGKTLPVIGYVSLGAYYALNKDLMLGSDGATHRAGFIGAWTSPDIAVNLPGLTKINFTADVQTGENTFGAWGGGIMFGFTPAIGLITGPVFFNDSTLMKQTNGTDFMWTFQIDVDVDLIKKKS